MTGQVTCANTVSHGRPSSDPGCDGGQVPFRCVFSSYCILQYPPPHSNSFIGRTKSINWRLTVYCTFTADVLYVQSGTYAFGLYMLCVLYFLTRTESRGRRWEHVVQYNLVDVAGHYAEQQGVLIYYRGQWSRKNWRWAERGANPFSPSPCCPHLLIHPSPPHPSSFPQPISALPHPGHAFFGFGPPACDWRGCPAAEDQL